MEFTSELVTHFGRWCSASSVVRFEELCNLVVMEKCKQSVPSFIATYFSERKVKTPEAAADLADEYVLTHKRIFGEQGQRLRFRVGGEKDESDSSRGSSQGEQRTFGNNRHITTCNYCQREGHWKNECPLLKSKKGF